MILANKNNERISASPGEKALCPICNEEVIAKCGEINIWHWAHKSLGDCDTWAEPESEWHLNWKQKFPKEMQEVVIGKHRADIVNEDGEIIELQNSPISINEIIEREEYYDNMIWLLNGLTLAKGLNLRKKKGIITFRWKYPPKAWWGSKKKIYIDLDYGNIQKFERFFITSYLKSEGYIFLIKKIYSNLPCGGWGIIISKEEFINGRRY